MSIFPEIDSCSADSLEVLLTKEYLFQSISSPLIFLMTLSRFLSPYKEGQCLGTPPIALLHTACGHVYITDYAVLILVQQPHLHHLYCDRQKFPLFQLLWFRLPVSPSASYWLDLILILSPTLRLFFSAKSL